MNYENIPIELRPSELVRQQGVQHICTNELGSESQSHTIVVLESHADAYAESDAESDAEPDILNININISDDDDEEEEKFENIYSKQQQPPPFMCDMKYYFKDDYYEYSDEDNECTFYKA
jgi:hypothetical protein